MKTEKAGSKDEGFQKKVPTILIVDDQDSNLELMTAILENEGYNLITSKVPEKALELARGCDPDLVVLDVMMPGVSGYDLCRKLKDAFRGTYLPIMLMTGLSQIEDRIAGLEAGADDFLSKPISTREVNQRVKTLLRLKSHDSEMKAAQGIIASLAGLDGHARRVGALCHELGLFIGLEEKAVKQAHDSGLFHDIGKSVSAPGDIRDHPVKGAHMCASFSPFREIVPAIRHHHERWDGKGSPDGLKGEDIPFMARLVAVADLFDNAMAPSDDARSTVKDAVSRVGLESGSGLLDPGIAKMLIDMALQKEDIIIRIYKGNP